MARQCRQTAVRLFITLAVLVASLLDAGAVDAVNGLSRGDNFVVYSRDRAWRTKVLRTAESASALWAKTLGNTLRPSAPILIVDRTRDGVPHGNTAIATGVFETDGMGMKVQVEVYESAGLREVLWKPKFFGQWLIISCFKKILREQVGLIQRRPDGLLRVLQNHYAAKMGRLQMVSMKRLCEVTDLRTFRNFLNKSRNA